LVGVLGGELGQRFVHRHNIAQAVLASAVVHTDDTRNCQSIIRSSSSVGCGGPTSGLSSGLHRASTFQS
jgi:hypothetical protein